MSGLPRSILARAAKVLAAISYCVERSRALRFTLVIDMVKEGIRAC